MDWTLRKPPLPLGEGWGEGPSATLNQSKNFKPRHARIFRRSTPPHACPSPPEGDHGVASTHEVTS